MTSILEVEQLDTLSSNASSTLTIGGTNTTTLNLGSNITGGTILATPAFQATISSTYIDLTNDTLTKVAFDTESFDTDGCYDNATNYRFTPTVAGKYFVYLELQGGNSTISDADIAAMNSFIYKNGVEESEFIMSQGATITAEFHRYPMSLSSIIDMNGSTDYVEGYVQMVQAGTRTMRVYGGTNSRFGAYKIIGA